MIWETFFQHFLKNSQIFILKESDFPEANDFFYFAITKILIIKRIIMFFEKSKELFDNKLEEEEKIFVNIMNGVKLNLNELKKASKYW